MGNGFKRVQNWNSGKRNRELSIFLSNKLLCVGTEVQNKYLGKLKDNLNAEEKGLNDWKEFRKDSD